MTRLVTSTLAFAALFIMSLWLAPASITVAAQQRGTTARPASRGTAAGTTGSVPRMADGHPDLSGVWWGGSDIGGRRGGGPRGGGRGTPAPTFASLYQPWAAEKAKTLSDKDDPTLRCVPTAFGTLNVRMWDVGAVGQIIATPKLVVMLTETYHAYQIIPTDGRPFRDEVPPAYRGDSVGHWEGETFVVETKNFTDNTWISAEGRVSFHSDQLRIVERYRRVDANTLAIDAVLEDPAVLTKPWVVPTQTLQLAPFDQILPLNCSGFETQTLIEGAGKPSTNK
jgi:hypothetical protein